MGSEGAGVEKLAGWRILSAVDEVVPGQSARARACSWQSEYSPEFLMMEMMAQAGGLVVGAVRDFSGNVVFAKVESAEFKEIGFLDQDQELIVEAFAREGVGDQGSWIDAQISSREKVCATARLFLIDAGDLDGTGQSVTFHEEFLEYYGVRGKIVKKD